MLYHSVSQCLPQGSVLTPASLQSLQLRINLSFFGISVFIAMLTDLLRKACRSTLKSVPKPAVSCIELIQLLCAEFLKALFALLETGHFQVAKYAQPSLQITSHILDCHTCRAHEIDRVYSSCFPVVEIVHTAKPFSTLNRPPGLHRAG